MTRARQIVAFGGGGFSMEAGNPLLDEYVLGLAAAIAWQESGFNNDMVSSANARGVMQVMPGTWDYVQQNLAQRPLDPASATDNVHAGVMYLKQLLNQSGGDEATAVAGYYQGISSVQNRGMFDDTQKYVANVQALRSRFGG